MFNAIKKLFPDSFKSEALALLSSAHDPRWEKYKGLEQQKTFVFLAGFYPNLGDMAITYAQIHFLKEIFPEGVVIPVSSHQTYASIKTIKNIIRKNDLITLIGGGNMDEHYSSLEDARLFVVKNFPGNKIVSFPQSVYFSDSPYGNKRLRRSRKVYSRHKDLTIFTREPQSFERIKKYFPTVKAELCPDIALTLDKSDNQCPRTDILCCMRNDIEQKISFAQRQQLTKMLIDHFDNVIFKDTVEVDIADCTSKTYEKTLNEFWNLIKQCKVVVTDRLHCMIFCVITGTPCVAMDNANCKISGIYNAWLPNILWIKMLEEYDENAVVDAVSKLAIYGETNRIVDLSAHFDVLKNTCKGNEGNE